MCKYKKTCKNYDESSDTCNICPDIDNHCGIFRKKENENV